MIGEGEIHRHQGAQCRQTGGQALPRERSSDRLPPRQRQVTNFSVLDRDSSASGARGLVAKSSWAGGETRHARLDAVHGAGTVC